MYKQPSIIKNQYPINFTSQGKPKARAADSVKTKGGLRKIKKYFLDRKQYRNYCLFVVGIATGYRCSDLLRLKFSDFFNDDYSFKKELDIIEQKTRKRRKMPITGNMRNAVKLYAEKSGTLNLDDYVFKSREGHNKPIDVSSARRIFNKMETDLNLPYHCSTHFLRKTFAYWFVNKYKNDMTAIATLQEMLNHSSEKITLRYCGIEKERQNEMIEGLDDLWGEILN